MIATTPLAGSGFGAEIRWNARDARTAVAGFEAQPDALPQALYAAQGLLLLRGFADISDDPSLLVRLSRLFGPEVENYHETLIARNMVHETVPEILIVSNRAPVSRLPPKRPDPPLTVEGGLPVRFPHRRGWHTDQSYRRPPPDISLFYAVAPTPKGEGQTLYANGIAAYEALAPGLRQRLDGMQGIHVKSGSGRTEQAVLAGEAPRPLAAHERPQRQPLVRLHPVTGQRALYLCEAGQMDWVDGPLVGVSAGPHGEGAKLLYELMTHLTGPRFTYVHEWERGELVIYDNRTLVHCATWFDAARHERVMWRTTVSGNPGVPYAGERKSWIA